MSKKSMMLVKSSWQDDQTFKMIPIEESCPYVECIYDPQSKVFVIISKVVKSSLHMLPKLDDYGQPMTGNKGAKQTRHKIDVFQEFYIEDSDAIKDIIKHFAVNSEKFDYDSLMKKEQKEKK